MIVPQYDAHNDESNFAASPHSSAPRSAPAALSSMLRHLRFRVPGMTPLRIALLAACSASVVGAQVETPPVSEKDATEWAETETGIPVTDGLTVEKCGSCHAPDDKGNLSRISWIRATPEGWSQTIKRMAKLNGLSITADEARSVVRYLSSSHGLAPEEAKQVMYIPERRILDETNIPDDDVRQACASCHAFGQPLSSRRSKREWALLQNMHVALYPQAEVQYNRPAKNQPNAGQSGDSRPAKPVTVGALALEYLAKNAPLHTPEWAAWAPRIRAPKLGGTWLISATLPGRGRYVGEMTVTPGKTAEEFITTSTLRSLATGEVLTRKGTGIVYAGYSWRGGSTVPMAKAGTADSPTNALRESMWFSPDQQSAQGRWYWGEYHEFGFDVTMTRATAAPTLSAISLSSVRTGTKNAEVQIFGAHLPTDVKPQDVDFGAGITVGRILSATPDRITATISIADGATPGLRDVAVDGAVLQKALPVYGRIDYLRVTPETALSHLGGVKYAKGYQQFEATGFSNGPDGKSGTPDDFSIGPVDVNWSTEEFRTVTYDDDQSHVGTLGNTSGIGTLFTPAEEGPNPKRRFGRNNYGEIWVVATAKQAKDKAGQPLSARAYLVVTVPTYKRWDQPELSQ